MNIFHNAQSLFSNWLSWFRFNFDCSDSLFHIFWHIIVDIMCDENKKKRKHQRQNYENWWHFKKVYTLWEWREWKGIKLMNKRWWTFFMWWFDFDRCLRDIGKMFLIPWTRVEAWKIYFEFLKLFLQIASN